MTSFRTACAIVTLAGAFLLRVQGATNTWGQILYTHYQFSRVCFAPGIASTMGETLGANETLKVAFKSGNWCAVFRPSEQERNITNAVGYMELSDLFSYPLSAFRLEDGSDVSPSIGTSIETMQPVPLPSRGDPFPDSTMHQAQHQHGSQRHASPVLRLLPLPQVFRSEPQEKTSAIVSTGWRSVEFHDVQWELLEVEDFGGRLPGNYSVLPTLKTRGHFIRVAVRVTNKTSEGKRTLMAPVLVDSKGRTFPEIDGLDSHLSDSVKAMTRIPPSNSEVFFTIFEVEEDSHDLKYQTRDLTTPGEAYNIPLNL